MTAERSTAIFAGYTVLCTAADGWISSGRHGLFHRDTRILSKYRLTIADADPDLVADSRPESDRWQAVLRVRRPGGNPEGPLLPQDALEIHVRRSLGPGLTEWLEVRNRSAVPCQTTLSIALDADFADVAEVGRERHQHGEIDRIADGSTLRLTYRSEHDGRRVERGVVIEVDDASSTPEATQSGIRWPVDLAPRGEWHARLRISPLPEASSAATLDADSRARQRAAWRRRRPSLEGHERLRRPFDRAADDLFDLRNDELEGRFVGSADGSAWVLNAGVPMFTGLFGRDVITAGWQSAMLGPRAVKGALQAIAATRAGTDDPWRDAEPGKLIHELRAGPLTELGLSPRDAYYGTQTTPAMFVLALSELWHWTGDLELLERYRDVALDALAWAERDGDADGDGFLEYERRSPGGLRNQGWKDSDEAIRHADGSIATVEEQAFYYIALERMAEILVALGDDARADGFLARAAALRHRWHDAYWMPDEGYYALALDGAKRQVRSITSNPGHALGTGIVPPGHAAAVADRLLDPDLFSGWGVRSISDSHPSYNPFGYHLGAVWPVEQATFALGFKRYGLDEHLDRLAGAVFDAADRSPEGRLPEALSGHARSSVPSPIPYPEANSPQAWSASALVQLVQITLGIYPFAPLRALAVVRPRLPDWLPRLTLHDLRVGRASVGLRFDRRPDGSAAWRVVSRRGALMVVGAGPPDDVTGGTLLERLEYGAVRWAPGRLVRAARIALGRWS
jgi:glycogen debranching enzyme